MKTLILLLIIVALGALFYRRSKAQDTHESLQGLLRERVQSMGRQTGLIVATVDGTGPHFYCEGLDGNTPARPVDPDTLFEIGSVTKVFTALLLADMVEQNEVRLEDPVSKYLPPSVKIPSRNGRQITLLDLATHTSGLPRMPINFAPKDAANPYADYSVAQLYEFLSGYALPRDIGAEYEYSNLGMGLLGHALALRAGTNYETLVLNRICRPLGMTVTAITLSSEQKARLATGYDEAGQVASHWDIPTLAGAGALRSSARDLVKFMQASLQLTETPLSSAFEMTQQPRHNTSSPDLEIGLAWHIFKRYGTNIVWHNGGTGGFHSFVGLDLKRKKGVVVLANSSRSVDDLGFHILTPAYPLSRVQPLKDRVAIVLPPATLDRYLGRYQLAPGIFFTLRRDGAHLMAQLTGQSYFEIFPESETEFFYKVVNAQLSFVTNADGAVTGLVLHQNGIDQSATKTKTN